jgi:hypothetical protein
LSSPSVITQITGVLESLSTSIMKAIECYNKKEAGKKVIMKMLESEDFKKATEYRRKKGKNQQTKKNICTNSKWKVSSIIGKKNLVISIYKESYIKF